MKIAIYTLGCKVNQYETQAIETELVRRGHTIVGPQEEADAYIINTCTVTAVSDQKSRQSIHRAQKKSPRAVVAVCGCYAQTDPEGVAALGVDLVGGASDRMKFLDDLEALAAARQGRSGDAGPEPLVTTGSIMSVRTFEELPAGGLMGRTRAMLKVEDGCVNFCTYCIIPFARGPVRSLSLDRAAAEAARLMAEGYHELVLTGIEISSWGQDLKNGQGPADLIEAVCQAAPVCRIRLGSLEPRTITEEFCRRVSALPNLCPHFHLSMQSGSDTVLQRMNRKYDTARFFESVELLRTWFHRPGITTDLIVGFPGETKEEFSETLDFLRRCRFTAMHIFPYSRREGTPADKMPGQLSKSQKEERAHRAAAVAREMEEAYLDSWIGQELPVLFEEEKNGLWRGHAPNYVEVFAPGEALHNVERSVKITERNGSRLIGQIIGA